MKHYKTAGVLLTVLLIMSAVAYWDEEKTKLDEEAEKTKNKLFSLNQSDVTKILFRSVHKGDASKDGANKDKEIKVELAKDKQDGWRLVSPVQGQADTNTTNTLISNVLDIKYTKEITSDPSKWIEYGLKNPTRIIRLETENGKTASLHIGSKAPVGYSVYVKTGDSDKVYLAGQQVLTATEKQLRDFRDKALVNGLVEADVVEIHYRKRGQPEVVLKKAEAGYQMHAPFMTEADQDESRDLIDSLSSQKVEDFVDQPQPELVGSFSDKQRWGMISWVKKDGTKGSVQISDYDDQFWMAFDPTKLVYKLSIGEKAKYDKDVLKLRDRRIFDFDSDYVERVDIDGTDYRRVKDKFYLAADAKKARKDSSVEAAANIKILLEDMEFAKTEKFLVKSEAKAVMDKAPQHRIKIWYKPKGSDSMQYTVDLFPKSDGDQIYVKRHDRETIYLVPDRVFSSLEKDDEDAPSSEEPLEPLDLDSLSN